MLIPSIDIADGRTVQLVQGKALKIDAGDPAPIAQRFAPLGEIAVIDLDAARGIGSNSALITNLCCIARCRVGGGIRDYDTAVRWLDAGAAKIILGTAATPDLLRRLPKERTVAALDSVHNTIVDHGWTRSTGAPLLDRIRELAPFVGGFLLTFVEIEGTMQGFDPARLKPLLDAAGDTRITAAGGITTADHIRTLDQMGVDAQIGMALYSGALDLTDAWAAPLRSDRPDGLFPTIVTDPSGRVLSLVYSNLDSIRASINSRQATYCSRTRGMWTKGATSGNTQHLLRLDLDCDRDAILFTVSQSGVGACHTGSPTCFGSLRGLAALDQRLTHALASSDPSSYTRRLAADPSLLRSKLLEESAELMDATEPNHIAKEAADLIYFTLARARAAGVSLSDIESELDARSLRITRRPGNAKPTPTSTEVRP
jgi:phosphoribosyl-ATP pyrophosphohydrolase/phosphoribosyl-AMP cyclohydrolase